jgi:hypothetical protein
MVEPVNFQHTLARTQIAEQIQDAAKQQQVADEGAFANELHKLERSREKEVQHTEQDQEGVKVREEEQNKKGRGEGHEREQHAGTEAPEAALPDEVTDDPDHHIDITA